MYGVDGIMNAANANTCNELVSGTLTAFGFIPQQKVYLHLSDDEQEIVFIQYWTDDDDVSEDELTTIHKWQQRDWNKVFGMD